jgi:hypothetical protein
MTTGAERAEALGAAEPEWLGPAEPERPEAALALREEPERPPAGGSRAFAALLIVLAAAWVGLYGWTLWQARPPLTLEYAVSWLATLSGPLVLLGLLWLLLGRSTRRETERFTRAVEEMRRESNALESVLEIVAGRIEQNHARLRGEAEKLMSLGDEASDRLGRVTYYLSKETASLGRTAAELESAAAAAKVDIGVLMCDLPRAEEQARAVTEAMKEAGLAAHGQAGALEAQLGALTAKGREADEVLGGGAQRLAAHVARVESGAATATAAIGDASAGMNAAVDGAMTRAAEAVEAARTALETQGAATLASIEQSRAALDRAGEDSARSLAARLDAVAARIETLAGHLSAQDAASHALVTRLDKELAGLDTRFAALGQSGTGETERLAAAVATVRDSSRELIDDLAGGRDRFRELIEQAQEMGRELSGVVTQLEGQMPAALAEVEAQAARTGESASSLVPTVAAVQASAEAAAERIAEAGAGLERQREAVEALLARIDEGSAGAEEKLQALAAATTEARESADRIAADTGPQLIEALLRVREAANQAAERAREAISEVIPASAASLGEAGRAALAQAVEETVAGQMEELSALAERSVDAARSASERLTRQMLTLGETAAKIEARIEAERRSRKEEDSEAFSRRVALLIESLNSTAIDVTKILSNDVTDSAWAAYLKGDRGVFTRRAVRLLDSSEAREIARHYEEEPEFREQVNRYVHDFESMLRRILADRDGSPLGVTILSSDMGKLYVALAQAIERIR